MFIQYIAYIFDSQSQYVNKESLRTYVYGNYIVIVFTTIFVHMYIYDCNFTPTICWVLSLTYVFFDVEDLRMDHSGLDWSNLSESNLRLHRPVQGNK